MTFKSLRNKILSAFFSGNTARGYKLSQEYSTGKTHYTPPTSYPTSSTRVYKDRDVLYSKPPRQSRPFLPVNQALEVGALYHKYPQLPGEFNKTYQRRLAGQFEYNKRHPVNLDRSLATYNADPTAKFFKKGVLDPSRKTFTAFDIESDDYNHPLSITAIKYQKDPATGEPVVIDTYQRFYKTHGWDVRYTQSVHGFTPKALKNLRKQQGATYGDTYDEQEMMDFHNFIGNSTLVGHNILLYDIPKSFPGLDIKNATIDTLNAARSAWKGMGNSLDEVFYRIYGKTMEEAGLDHHDASSDTIASMMIAEAMSKDEGIVGKSIKYVMNANGRFHIAEWNEYVNSMLTRGRYWRQWSQNKENEVFMDEYELGLAEKGDKDSGEVKKWLGNMHLMSPEDQALIQSSVRETANNMSKLEGVNPLGDSELRQALNEFNNYKRFSLIERLSHAKSELESDYILSSAGYESKGQGWVSLYGMSQKLKEARAAQKAQEFEESKDHKIDRYKKYHYLSEADEAALRATKSFEELSDAIEDVTKKNEEQRKVLGAIASIKPYDINNLISAARGQWQGVMGATKGVVPNFLRNPIGRLGDAAFNAVDRSISPWNAFGRATSSILGPMAGMMMYSGNPVAMGIGAGLGGLSALSQIGGNYAQAKVEMFGLQLQNNLNTLGAMISWITTPFQLLHKAIKLVTGAFGGLTFKLNNIMGSGIGMMSQMGNPLEPLTGVSYLDYQKAGLIDMASLLKGGSTNSAIETMSMMQRDLYRYGKVDVDKMIAANMLGVFGDVFTPTTDMAEAYYNVANKILRRMQGASADERANLLYYTNKLNPSLAQTIRSADMLGVSDVRELSEPGSMYWRPIRSELTEEEKRRGVKYTEEQRFRRTQREYGIATQQFGYTKMRFADRLWNIIGRDLYNGFNELIDHIAGGDWKASIEDAKTMWASLKETFTKIWSGENGIGDSVSEGLSKGLTKIKQWGMDIAISIIDIWNQLFRVILDKAQGAIAYLSTAQIKLVKGENGWGIDITTIKDVQKDGLIYDTDVSYSSGMPRSQKASKGAEGYAAVIDALFPEMSKWEKQNITRESLAEKLRHLPGVIKDGVLTTPTLDLPEYHLHGLNLGENPELINPLLDYLAMYESKGAGMRKSASAWLSPELRPYLDDKIFQTGLLPAYDQFVSDTMNTLYTARNMVSNDSRKLEADINVNVGDKKVGTVQIRNGGLTFEGFRPLSSTGYTKGIEVAGTKVSGGN